MKRIQKCLFASLFLFVIFSCDEEESKNDSSDNPDDEPAVEYSVMVHDNNSIDITTPEQLDAIRYDLNGDGKIDKNANATAYGEAFGAPSCPAGCKGYELMGDIDFTGSKWATDKGWEPIGSNGNSQFNATFEGNGHTVSNIHINRPTTKNGIYGALFGYTGFDAKISNVGIEGGSVKAYHAAGLVGSNAGTITNCYSTAKITAVAGSASAGGLVVGNAGQIIACYATGKVEGNGRAGGLASSNSSLGIISACYATGNVISKGNRNSTAGGLVGINLGAAIYACYATGNATASTTGSVDLTQAGGLAGESSGRIRACYAAGNATAQAAGGLVGTNTGNVIASYATGTATESTGGQARGLIGKNKDDGEATNSYFDYETSGREASEKYAKSTSELQTPTDYTGIYSDWNVDVDLLLIRGVEDGTAAGDREADDPWDFGTSTQYPALKVDFDASGDATVGEFGDQIRSVLP